MHTREDIHETLVRGRAALITRGWCRNRLRDDTGRLCLRGALNVGASGKPWELMLTMDQKRLVDDCLQAMGFIPGLASRSTYASYWNDHLFRKASQVIRRFDEAIHLTAPILEAPPTPTPPAPQPGPPTSPTPAPPTPAPPTQPSRAEITLSTGPVTVEAEDYMNLLWGAEEVDEEAKALEVALTT